MSFCSTWPASSGRNAPTAPNHGLQILASAFKLAQLSFPTVSKLSEKDCVRSGFFSEAEFRLVYQHLPKDLKDFALFGYLTGWRKGAISQLTWNDVHEGNVYLRGVLSKNGSPYFVPIVGELSDLIERRKAGRAFKTPNGVMLSNFVFHRKGAPVYEMRKAWATACKKAGCPGRIFHDFRRSAARNLVRSGVTEAVAMKVTGHKTRSMFDRYNITNENDLREAMNRVDAHHKAEQQKVVQIAK
jgi:integrase